MGFMTSYENEPTLRYINTSTLNSDEVVLKIIDSLLTAKYIGTIFYCHNFKGFDGIFILKILSTFNQNNIESQYKMTFIARGQ